MNKKTQQRLLKAIVHIGALLPLAILIWEDRTGNLGTDPVREITLRTGYITIILLMLTLACTPVNIIFGWKQAISVRKMLGLYTSLYVTLHLLSFVWLDYYFQFEFLLEDIPQQRYILVGLTAFILLIPLTVTSNKWSMRKLGRNWRKLHKLIYLIGILAVVHFLWLVKNVYTRPLIFAAILAFLLIVRINPVKKGIAAWRKKQKMARRSAAS